MTLRCLVSALLAACVAVLPAHAQSVVSPAEARAIAEEAYIYSPFKALSSGRFGPTAPYCAISPRKAQPHGQFDPHSQGATRR
jgi:hypothetical protein